jgi:uncharacterized protein YlaI
MTKAAVRKYNRSGECNCAICNMRTTLVEHHIRGRKIKNANHPSNLVWVCPNCHDQIHCDNIEVEGWAFTTTGQHLIWNFK